MVSRWVSVLWVHLFGSWGFVGDEFRDKPDGMRNVFRGEREGVTGGLGPPRAWST